MYPYTTSTMPMQVIQVSGENGARAFQMPANSSTLLLDNSAPIVWFVQTDGAGYKTVTPYDINPHIEKPPVDVKALEERIAMLEVTLKEALTHEKPHIVTAEQDPESNVWKPTERKATDGYY